LAYYELHTALALILHRFEIRLAQDPVAQEPMEDSTEWREGFPDDIPSKRERWSEKKQEWRKDGEFELYDRFLSDRNGPMVEFRKRA
jgi:hypothetical protein